MIMTIKLKTFQAEGHGNNMTIAGNSIEEFSQFKISNMQIRQLFKNKYTNPEFKSLHLRIKYTNPGIATPSFHPIF